MIYVLLIRKSLLGLKQTALVYVTQIILTKSKANVLFDFESSVDSWFV